MTSPAGPSYAGCAFGFACAGCGIGYGLGYLIGSCLLARGSAANMTDVANWASHAMMGGIVAGFAVGLAYAFLRRPAANREDAE